MWLGPALFIVVTVFLWRYIGAVFMPELLARVVFGVLPVLEDMELVILVNAAILYFGGYCTFALFWPRLKPYLRNPFLAGFVLWLANITLLFPVLGKGVLGYRMPQGWISASFPLLVAHWTFARGLQFQERRSNQTVS
jgi:hypothetical protein